MVEFELARRHYVYYAINTTTSIAVANDAKGIKVKLLVDIYGKPSQRKKTIFMQVFKRAYKQHHSQCSPIINNNSIETFKGDAPIGKYKF